MNWHGDCKNHRMKSIHHYLILSLLGMVLTAPAMAAEESFVIASASGAQRFMPLAPVRDGVVRVDNGLRRAPMRSDRAAMDNGFMRLDRTHLRPRPSFRGTSAARPVTVLRGQPAAAPAATRSEDQTITDLFAAPEASSFRDAMRGGAVRHAWPVDDQVRQRLTSGYGMRKDPFHGRPSFHGGIDIAAAVGTPILASAEGTVSKVATGKGLGNYVAVQHRDGTESYYGHMRAQSVRVGQRVMQGQKVGELGSTGRSTGPHLDYRIKKNGATFNPMTVLRQPATRVASR